MYDCGQLHVKTAVSVVITVNIFISLLECYLMHENKISIVTFVFVFAQLLVSGILWTGKRNRSVILLKLFSGFQGFFIAICSVALVFCLYSQICMSSFMSYNGYKSRKQERARMFLLIYTLMVVCHIVIASISLYTINKLIKYWLKAGNSDLESIDL